MKAFNEIIYTSEEIFAKSAEVDKVKSDKKSLFREGFEVGQEIDIKLTASEEGNVSTTGNVTADKFYGDGSNLTNIGPNIDSLAVSKIAATGTPNSTTYLRGDGVWQESSQTVWSVNKLDTQTIDTEAWTDIAVLSIEVTATATSKFLITGVVNCGMSAQSNKGLVRLRRGSTVIGSVNAGASGDPDVTGFGVIRGAEAYWRPCPAMITYLDTPGVGTHTYKIQGLNVHDDSNLLINGHGTGSFFATSHMTIQKVAP